MHFSLTRGALAGALLLAAWATASAANPPSVQLMSKSSTGSGNGASNSTQTSANGRVVVFTSEASNLASGLADANGTGDVFAFDVTTGALQLVSVNRQGTGAGNRGAYGPSISADGRYVAFSSASDDLVSGGSPGIYGQIYVRDLQTKTTRLASWNAAGTGPANGSSGYPAISGNGEVVAFPSLATDLTPGDNNNAEDIYARNLRTGVTYLVSERADHTGAGNGPSGHPRLTPDGRYVVFASGSDNLVPGMADGVPGANIFLRDLKLGTTALASVTTSGHGVHDNLFPYYFQVTPDGRYVTFASGSPDLDPTVPDTNGREDVFVRDMRAGITRVVSLTPDGSRTGNDDSNTPTISADGRWVAFETLASDLTSNDTNDTVDVFVRDMLTNKSTLVTVNAAGDGPGSGWGIVAIPQISPDGRFVTFESVLRDLIPGGTNDFSNVFRRDLVNGLTQLVSRNAAGTGSGNESSWNASPSSDGRVIAFESWASDLVPNDTNGRTQDTFVSTVNTAPVAAPDVYRITRGQSLAVPSPGVLKNDRDLEGSPLTAVLATQPRSGTLTFRANGSFDYTPGPNFVGTDSFTYRATDGTDASAPATVEIQVSTPGAQVSGSGEWSRRTTFAVTAMVDARGSARGTVQFNGPAVTLTNGIVTAVTRSGTSAEVYGHGLLDGRTNVEFVLRVEDVSRVGAGQDRLGLALSSGLTLPPAAIVRGDLSVR